MLKNREYHQSYSQHEEMQENVVGIYFEQVIAQLNSVQAKGELNMNAKLCNEIMQIPSLRKCHIKRLKHSSKHEIVHQDMEAHSKIKKKKTSSKNIPPSLLKIQNQDKAIKKKSLSTKPQKFIQIQLKKQQEESADIKKYRQTKAMAQANSKHLPSLYKKQNHHFSHYSEKKSENGKLKQQRCQPNTSHAFYSYQAKMQPLSFFRTDYDRQVLNLKTYLGKITNFSQKSILEPLPTQTHESQKYTLPIDSVWITGQEQKPVSNLRA